MIFTTAHPCRCGYDGTGTHRCHVGRPDPHGTGEDGSRWCPRAAVERFATTPGALSGMQLKFSVTTLSYCPEHLTEFLSGKDPTPPEKT